VRTPEPMPSKKSPRVGFSDLVDSAIQSRTALQNTAGFALSTGVDPQTLIDYARGRASPAVKSEAEMMVMSSPWAMSRVLALVRAARDPSSLGAGILRTVGNTNPYEWGMTRTEDPQMDLALLLERIG